MKSIVNDEGNSTHGTITAVVPDLFFSVTVRNAIRTAGYDARMVRTVADIQTSPEAPPPRLVIVDLSAVGGQDEWDTVTATRESGVPVLVFGPHKNVDGFRAAKAARVSRVVSNGQFHADMVGFITRYATGDADIPEGGDDLEEVVE